MRKYPTFGSVCLLLAVIFGIPSHIYNFQRWVEWLGMLGSEWQWWNYLLVSIGIGGLLWIWVPKVAGYFYGTSAKKELYQKSGTLLDKAKAALKWWWQSEIAERHYYEEENVYYENSLGEKAWNLFGVFLKWTLFIPAMIAFFIFVFVLFWGGLVVFVTRLFGA